jgi:hypothetical protein
MKKAIIISIVLAALLAFVACTKQQQNQHQPSKQNLQSANEFWADFREVVLKKDKMAIASMTIFPFIVYSEDNNNINPMFSFDKESFSIMFDTLLHMEREPSLYEIIRQTETITPENFEDQFFVIGNFRFAKIDGKWFLSTAELYGYPELIATGPKGTPQQSFQDFWDRFRQAVLTNDKDAIVSMASFSFEVCNAGLDSDVEYIDQKKFRLVLDEYLNSNAGTRNKPETMRAVIKRTTIIDENKNCIDNTCVIGNFEFWKMMGKWYFIAAASTATTPNDALVTGPDDQYVDLKTKKTDPQRKQILEISRTEATKLFGIPVRFFVRFLAYESDWAIALLVPVTETGKVIDWNKTKASRFVEKGVQPGWINFLMKKHKGKWSIIDFSPDSFYAKESVFVRWPKQNKDLPSLLLDSAEVATNCDPCR